MTHFGAEGANLFFAYACAAGWLVAVALVQMSVQIDQKIRLSELLIRALAFLYCAHAAWRRCIFGLNGRRSHRSQRDTRGMYTGDQLPWISGKSLRIDQ